MHYTYLLRCADGTLYGGYTTDLQKRLEAHNSGKGAKYTRARLPVALVWWEEYPTKEEAMAREYAVKHLSRAQKLALVEGFSPPPVENYHYYMYHKPFGCVTARRDDRYPTVMDAFAGLQNPELSPVGRLDRETEGLLFITDDGQWNRQMTRPEFRKEKVYAFTLLGDLTEEKRTALEGGVLLNGDPEPTAPAKVTVTGKSTLAEVLPTLHPEIAEKTAHNPGDRVVTFGTIAITEGRNRQIRRMMKAVRCLVLQLKRLSVDGIPLDETLAPGEWKEIFPKNM